MSAIFRRLSVVIFLTPLLFIGACGRTPYGIDIVNHGQHGVIVIEFGTYGTYVEKEKINVSMPNDEPSWQVGTRGLAATELVTRLYPHIPSLFRNPADSMVIKFPGYERNLPDKVDVAWQLADLSNCSKDLRVYPGDSMWAEVVALGFDPSTVVSKSACTWHPLPDKVFRQTIDMAKVRNSDAVKKAGRNVRLNITFEFIENELRVVPKAFAINRWK